MLSRCAGLVLLLFAVALTYSVENVTHSTWLTIVSLILRKQRWKSLFVVVTPCVWCGVDDELYCVIPLCDSVVSVVGSDLLLQVVALRVATINILLLLQRHWMIYVRINIYVRPDFLLLPLFLDATWSSVGSLYPSQPLKVTSRLTENGIPGQKTVYYLPIRFVGPWADFYLTFPSTANWRKKRRYTVLLRFWISTDKFRVFETPMNWRVWP